MKNTCIFIDDENEFLLYAFSSETAWIPLEIGTIIRTSADVFEVTRKEFDIGTETINYWVKNLENEK